jgi:phosphate-selective porin OprO/OprP
MAVWPDAFRHAAERGADWSLAGRGGVFLLAWALIAGPDPVAASRPAPPRLAVDTTRPPSIMMDAGGLTVRSPGGDYALSLGGDVQVDGRFILGDAPASRPSTLDLRRVRPKLDVRLRGRHQVHLMANFASGRAVLQDAYVETRITDDLSLWIGRFKMPVGLEFIQSPNNLLLAERGYPTRLVPLRDVAAVATGRLFDDRLHAHAGVLNGVADGTNGFGDLDPQKDLLGRLYLEPIRRADVGVGVGLAGTVGVHTGTPSEPQLPSFQSIAGQPVFGYRTSSDAGPVVRADGRSRRIVPQLYARIGPVGVLGEFVHSSQAVAAGEPSASGGEETLINRSWQIAASVALTGENATFGRLTPLHPLDPTRGQWGAVEVAGRVQQIRIDDDTFPTFADPRTEAERMTSATAGVNWHLDANVRLTLNYVLTQAETPAGPHPLSPEHFVLARFQVAF